MLQRHLRQKTTHGLYTRLRLWNQDRAPRRWTTGQATRWNCAPLSEHPRLGFLHCRGCLQLAHYVTSAWDLAHWVLRWFSNGFRWFRLKHVKTCFCWESSNIGSRRARKPTNSQAPYRKDRSSLKVWVSWNILQPSALTTGSPPSNKGRFQHGRATWQLRPFCFRKTIQYGTAFGTSMSWKLAQQKPFGGLFWTETTPVYLRNRSHTLGFQLRVTGQQLLESRNVLKSAADTW